MEDEDAVSPRDFLGMPQCSYCNRRALMVAEGHGWQVKTCPTDYQHGLRRLKTVARGLEEPMPGEEKVKG